MRAYTAYRRMLGAQGQTVAEETIVVPDGFAWGAYMFGPFWAVANGRWRAAAALAAGWITAGVLAAFASDPVAGAVLWIITALWAGFSARDLEVWSLESRGWRASDVALARSLIEAEAALIASENLAAAAASGGRETLQTLDVERRW